VFEELSPVLEAVLAQGHPGVVIALVGACRRVGTHQAQVLQLLLEVSMYYLQPIFALGTIL
jgi:nucleolar protein 9